MSKKSSSRGHSSPQRGRMRNARPARAHNLAISRRNSPPLSLLRQVTHSRKIRIPSIAKRVSQQNVFRGFLPQNMRSLHITLQPTVCQKRQQRRRSLFALGLTGKGATSPKIHTLESKVRCK